MMPVLVLLAACNEQVGEPTYVTAVGGDGEAIVAWDDVEGATGYNVYWNATGKATGEDNKASGVTSPFVATGLRNEGTYYFRVTASGGTGESSASQQVTARSTAAKLRSINITPAALRMALGTRQYLSAAGVYSDGSTQNLSGIVKWSSSNKTALSIIEDGKGAGRVIARDVGSSDVTASYRGVVAVTRVTVQRDTLDSLSSLTVTPNNQYVHPVSLDPTARVVFKLAGTFASGLTQDLTATATWSSDQPAIASISNALGSEGVAKGLANGTSNVSATVTFGANSIATSTLLTVTDLNIVALMIISPDNVVAVGDTRDIAAQATFSDGSVQDVTRTAAWRSDNTGVLQVLPNYGRITGMVPGVANVTAEIPGSGLTFTKSFTVIPATPRTLRVTPNTVVLAPGATQQITAAVEFTDGSTITQGLAFISSNAAVAQVDGSGLITAVARGVADVQVHYAASTGQTMTASVAVAVTPNLSAPFDHALFLTACAACHLKPSGHPVTSNQCEACHRTDNFLPLTVDHTQVSGFCTSCHNGVLATGKPVTHLATTAQCSACHATAAWKPAGVDHGGFVNNCVVCHNGIAASGKAGKHNLGLTTSDRCETCHAPAPATWKPAVSFDHAQTTSPCANCHGTGLATVGKPASHIVTAAPCDGCHNTTAWLPAH